MMTLSGIVAGINRNFVLPMYMRWNRDGRLARLREIEERQWLSRDEIAEQQFRDLRELILFAYRHVPYYRERFDAIQVSPEDIRGPDDVKKLPILTKRDLQENAARMMSDNSNPSQTYRDASGGSTGRPTIFYGDSTSLYRKFAAVSMTDKWTGWNIGERSAYLWGADREANLVRSVKHNFVEKHIFRREILNAFSLTEERMHKFSQQILRERPTLIIAYSNAAYQFARFVRQNNIAIFPPKGIVCSAETLSDEKRSLIEAVFQCKVLNRYGSREVGLIASECPCQEGLHVNANDIYVELEPIAGRTEDESMGEVIVTDLTNRVMPLIRYNMGDLALFREKPCRCGRGLPVIGHVTGRSSDFIVHPDGRLIHGEFFSHAFYGVQGVSQFQIIQQTLGTIEINVVTKDGLSAKDKARLAMPLRAFLGNGVKVVVNEVADIAVPSSGKFRFAISYVTESGSQGGRGVQHGRSRS